MGSIRDNILVALVARLAGINADWSVQLRASLNNAEATVQVVVQFISEAKSIANNQTYLATMNVGVLIVARAEDADEHLDDANPYRYLDRLVTAVEKQIHAPDSWGLDPDFTDVAIIGHDVQDPSDDNEVAALLRLSFKYRHDFQNPEA